MYSALSGEFVCGYWSLKPYLCCGSILSLVQIFFSFVSNSLSCYYHTLPYPKTKEKKIWTKDKIEPQHLYWSYPHFFFFSSQIETIDDPVPAVEAILRRCNKHQVLKITLVYNEGHVRVLCTSNFGLGSTNKVSFTSFPCKGRHFKYANKENLNTWKITLVMYATLKRKPQK